MIRRVLVACVLALAACPGARATPSAPAVEAGRFAVPEEVGTLVVDPPAFAAFATRVRPDLEREAASKDPAIAKDRLFVLAMLDGLDSKWPSALALLDRAAAFETTPEAKAMTGLTLRVWAEVGGDATKFRAQLATRIGALPIDKLGDALAMLHTMAKVFTPDVCRQLVNQEVGPQVKHGTVGMEELHAIVFQRYAVVRLVPVSKDIDDVLTALSVPTAGQ